MWRRGWVQREMLAFDLETTGVDLFQDVPVSFALVSFRRGRAIGARTAVVNPGRRIPDAATAVHGITTARAAAEGMPLDDAVHLLAESILRASRRGVPLVGMKLDFDLTILDTQWRRITGRGLEDCGFQGPVVDALVLDRHVDRFRGGSRRLSDLCAHYEVAHAGAHDARADAAAAGGVVVAICRRFPEIRRRRLAELHADQRMWHRTWASTYDAWRRHEGLPTLEMGEEQWPIALACGRARPAIGAGG